MKATSSVGTLRKNGFSFLNTNVCSIHHKLPFVCDGKPAKLQSNMNYRFDVRMQNPGYSKVPVLVEFVAIEG